MNLVCIYQGLSDENRLRIVHLLAHGPLGVKHLQNILGISQVRVSKHLAYLRERGIVEVDRTRNWMFYRLPVDPAPELKAHFSCLTECVRGTPVFEADMVARQAIQPEVERVTRVARRVEPQERLSPPASAQSTVGGVWGPYGDSDYVD